MSTEALKSKLRTADQIANPLSLGQAGQQVSVGALVNVESQRAIAEVQARMMIARANPRNAIQCMDAILQDCMRPTLADTAVYNYARGGSDISGPSIKLAEALARRWGNIAAGIKELSRGNGYSECVAYAWDLETGYYDERQFQVRHWRDTKKGGYQLTDERDIYELTANMGQRRKRAVLLSVIPGDVVEAAVAQCEATMKTTADTSPEAMKKMVEAFEKFDVTKAQIEERIQRRLDAIQPAQVVSLKKIYASLRDGMSIAVDWFDLVEPTTGSEGLKAKVAPQKSKAAPTMAPEPAAEVATEDETYTVMFNRIKACTDIEVLDLVCDEIRDMFGSNEQAKLFALAAERRAELEGQ